MKTKIANARTFMYAVRYFFAIARDPKQHAEFMEDMQVVNDLRRMPNV